MDSNLSEEHGHTTTHTATTDHSNLFESVKASSVGVGIQTCVNCDMVASVLSLPLVVTNAGK